MTPEEKVAVQTVLMKEITDQATAQPTLLFDLLVSGQGYQFIHHVLSKHLAQANQASQICGQLLQAIKQAPASEDAA